MERRSGGRVVRSLIAVLALAAAFSALPAQASAAAQKPCWRAVVNDWANGGINRRHHVGCYRSALHNLPNDIRTYTTAEDDIRRALLEEIRSMRGTDDGSSNAAQAQGERSDASSDTGTPTRSLQGRGQSGGIPLAAAPAAEASPPLRAIVAAVLALALVLAAAIGKYHVRRRTQNAPS